MVPPSQGCHRQRGRLTPTWALEKAQSGAVSRSIAMSRGQTPRPRHDGPLRTGGGLAQAKRRGGCRTGPHGPVRRPGNPPVLTMPPSRGAWRCKPGRGCAVPGRADEAHRLQARRAETVLAATAGPPTRRSRHMGRQRKASQGTLAALLRLRPSREAADRPLQLTHPTPAPGLRDAAPGRGGCVLRARADRKTRAGASSARRLDAPSGRVRCGCGGDSTRESTKQHRVGSPATARPAIARGAGSKAASSRSGCPTRPSRRAFHAMRPAPLPSPSRTNSPPLLHYRRYQTLATSAVTPRLRYGSSAGRRRERLSGGQAGLRKRQMASSKAFQFCGTNCGTNFITYCFYKICGGEGGIRTLGTLLTYTHFPGVLLKPLGHLSGGRKG